MGKISENNTRTLITIPKKLKEELEKIATEENRSLNNLIVTTLKNYVENYKQNKQ